MGVKEEILNLSNHRYELLDKRNASWDEKILRYTYDPLEIDELGDTIYNLLNNNQDELNIEFIIEELTKLGLAPSLLYDDNGNFAICDNGVQTLSYKDEPCDVEIIHFIEKNKWKSTIREALKYYFEN